MPNEDWKDRVLQERHDLEGKIKQLSAYLDDAENTTAISHTHLRLLIEQLGAMQKYYGILCNRIALF